MVLAHIRGGEVIAHVVIELGKEHDAFWLLKVFFAFEGDSRSYAHHNADDGKEEHNEKRTHQRCVNGSPTIPMEHRFHLVVEGMGCRTSDSFGEDA